MESRGEEWRERKRGEEKEEEEEKRRGDKRLLSAFVQEIKQIKSNLPEAKPKGLGLLEIAEKISSMYSAMWL